MTPGLLIEDVTVAPMRVTLNLRHDRACPGHPRGSEGAIPSTEPRYLGLAGRLSLVGVGGRDKPGHDGGGYDGTPVAIQAHPVA